MIEQWFSQNRLFIPSRYKKVDYIVAPAYDQNSGIGAHIVLDYIPNTDTRINCKMTIAQSGVSNYNNKMLFGNSNLRVWYYTPSSSAGVTFFGRTLALDQYMSYITTDEPHTYYLDKLVLTVDDNNIPLTGDLTSATSNNLMIGSNGLGSNRYLIGDIYSFEVRERTLKAKLYPVQDTETGEYGMYDVVGHKFYGSATSTKYTGPIR